MEQNKRDEEVPYRATMSSLPQVATPDVVDEQEISALRRALVDLKLGMDGLSEWDAFDLTESELKIKQQIKAHQLAYHIVAPVYEAIKSTVETIDAKYRSK